MRERNLQSPYNVLRGERQCAHGPPTSAPQPSPCVPDPAGVGTAESLARTSGPGGGPVLPCRPRTPGPVGQANPSGPIRSVYQRAASDVLPTLEAAPASVPRRSTASVQTNSNMFKSCHLMPWLHLVQRPEPPSRLAAALRMSLRHREIAPEPHAFCKSKSLVHPRGRSWHHDASPTDSPGE